MPSAFVSHYSPSIPGPNLGIATIFQSDQNLLFNLYGSLDLVTDRQCRRYRDLGLEREALFEKSGLQYCHHAVNLILNV